MVADFGPFQGSEIAVDAESHRQLGYWQVQTPDYAVDSAALLVGVVGGREVGPVDIKIQAMTVRRFPLQSTGIKGRNVIIE